MPIIDYSADLRLPNGKIWLSVECRIDVEAERDHLNGDWTLNVNDVLFDVSTHREPSSYVSTFCEAAKPLMAQMGHEIIQIAEADDALLSEVLDDQREAA
ncbi:hypothetical protein [uncultured Nitratireductor sp.]|uniref:hypothetical protein n=1 Tax=uncultured Nitratireductor sp. TaxID=520953 RepID=UPI0025E71CED|nr:hypothetical protein [uncultured Nitratireductor sp.]